MRALAKFGILGCHGSSCSLLQTYTGMLSHIPDQIEETRQGNSSMLDFRPAVTVLTGIPLPATKSEQGKRRCLGRPSGIPEVL